MKMWFSRSEVKNNKRMKDLGKMREGVLCVLSRSGLQGARTRLALKGNERNVSGGSYGVGFHSSFRYDRKGKLTKKAKKKTPQGSRSEAIIFCAVCVSCKSAQCSFFNLPEHSSLSVTEHC